MAKKKAPAKPKGKTPAKVKKSTSPRSNVKVLEGPSNKQMQKIVNAQRTADTKAAKSGEKAKRLAGLVEQENKRGPKTVIKIRTGGGMGGMFNTKNR